MAIYKRDIASINLETGTIHRTFLNHSIGYKDQKADHFGIRVFRDGEPVDLTGVSVQGVFMPPQGDPIAITSGNIVSGNEAEVVLPQACYNYDGQFCLAIKLVDSNNSVTGTMRIVDGMVDNTHASGTVAPTSAVPTYQEILSTYDAMVAATAAANGAIAATYSSSSTYKVGDYCIHDGGLYRCTTAITTAEAWTSGHWTAAKIGPDVSDLKSAFVNGTKAITGQKIGIFQSGYYETREDGTTVVNVTSPQTDANFACTYFPVTEGDIVYIYGSGTTGVKRLYSYLDSSMKAKSRSAASLSGLQKLTVPSGVAYIVINTLVSYTGYYALLGENTDATLSAGITAEATARGNADTVLQNEIDSTNMKIPYTYFESGSFNATTGAESDNANAVRSRNFIPFDALYRITGDSGVVHTYLYFYTVNGDYIAQSGNIGNSYNILQKATYLATYPTIHYVRIRFGDTSNPTTTATMSTQHIAVSVLEQPMLRCGDVETKDIAGKGTNGAYTSSFTHLIPFNGEYKNQIVTCVCKYERESGVTAYPKIYFATGENLNRTSAYELGKEGQYVTKAWRVIRYPGDITDYKVSFEIPTGCTVYIREFFNEYDDEINRGEKGLLIHGHRKMPMTPNDTIHAVLMAAKAGKRSFVEIPKRLSDGTWICYHDDTLVYNDTYIRQANGSQLPSTYNGTLWSAISFETANSWDWGISRGSLFAGTKPMTLNEFFMTCAKTGIHPVLSLHPFPTAEQFAEIKAIAKKCGVLDKLELKTGFGNDLAVAYGVFGNEIEEYVFDMPSGERTAQSITNAINALNAFTGCTVKRGIELFSSSAYLAYFGSNQFDPYAMIAQAGFVCALCHQNGAYSPTVPGVSTSIMYGKDFEWWAENHGVTEFTDDYNYSDGLNW